MSYRVRHYDVLESTQNQARLLIAQEQNNAAGLVVVADTQTQGRGRHGRVWESAPGNLTATIVLNNPPYPGHYAFIAALATHQAAAQFVETPALLKLKWPNDLLYRGEKLSGVLLEQEGGYLLLGFGMNIVHAPERCARLGDGFAVADVLQAFLSALAQYESLYNAQGFAAIRVAWIDRATGLGLPMVALLPKTQICGVFQGLDEDGALLIQLTDGTLQSIHAGEVFFDAARG